MTNREIGVKLGEEIRVERKSTNRVLTMVNLGLERRAYLEHGFQSMFGWLTRGFGYSNAAAYRRIESAKLLKAVPGISAKLETGEMNLTTVSKVQAAIKVQEKVTGQKVAASTKALVIDKVSHRNEKDTEQTLMSLFPESASTVHYDRRITIDENTTRLSTNFPNQVTADLNRAKEVLSHKFPNAKDAEIIAYALRFLLDRVDPLRKPDLKVSVLPSPQGAPGVAKSMTRTASAPEAICVKNAKKQLTSKSRIRRTIIRQAGGCCTFQDPLNGRVCGSRYQIQIDHMIPKALGGTDEAWNLRVRCREHNIYEAGQIFGVEFMEQFRKL